MSVNVPSNKNVADSDMGLAALFESPAPAKLHAPAPAHVTSSHSVHEGGYKKRKGKRGGASGWNYVLGQVGPGNVQMENAMKSPEWNAIRSTHGGPYSVATNPANARGGYKRGGSFLGKLIPPAALWAAQNKLFTKKRGGSFANVGATALAPAVLWAAQNRLTRKSSSKKFYHKKSRKNERKYRKSYKKRR